MQIKTPLQQFRVIAILEGWSYILLGFTMILKYQFAMPQPNYVVGMAHGVLFMLYILLLLRVSYILKWKFWQMTLAFLVSLVPFGTFYAEKKWFSKW
jgi:integral membrane protein